MGSKSNSYTAGGGGGTFVIKDSQTPIIIAGGGGSRGTNDEDYNSNASPFRNGNNGAGDTNSGIQYYGDGGSDGGAGFNSYYGGGGGGLLESGRGNNGGKAFIHGGKGAIGSSYSGQGGFGGGGCCIGERGGAGGGGYSGGGGGGWDTDFGWLGGGGGGSYGYNNGITTITDNGPINYENGKVIITFLSTTLPNIQENNFITRQRQIQLQLEEQEKKQKIYKKEAKNLDREIQTANELFQLQLLEKEIYKNSDKTGIKNDLYIRESNDKIRIKNELAQWFMLIKILTGTNSGWQGIIGNMYNSSLDRGWGLWINPSGNLHWSFADGGVPSNTPSDYKHLLYQSSYNLNKLGVLKNQTPYEIKINYRENILKFTLNNLITGETKTESLDKMPIITNIGYVTIGGNWIKKNEKFNGDINYVEILTTNWELSRYPETYIPNFQSEVTNATWTYKRGPCHKNYMPNKNDYHGGTDCGRNNGIYNDWISKGGNCPDGQWNADWCGTGCQKGGGYCADP